jgi:hypothetical protein
VQSSFGDGCYFYLLFFDVSTFVRTGTLFLVVFSVTILLIYMAYIYKLLIVKVNDGGVNIETSFGCFLGIDWRLEGLVDRNGCETFLVGVLLVWLRIMKGN